MNYNCYQIKVPGTSANLGSGFDTLGVALNIYNRFTVQALKEKKLVIEGVEEKFSNENNLFYTSMLEVFKVLKINPPGIRIVEDNGIPFGKGLGSSASCIVGGLVAGNLISDNKLSKQEILNIATRIEGYPDNVTPALFGNLTASMMLEDETVSLVNKVNPVFNFSILIPDFDMPTKEAREILPNNYEAKDIVYNISHALLTYESLIEGNVSVLSKALGDRLHQPYRLKFIDDYSNFIEIFKSYNVLGSYLSGAGPSIVLITKDDDYRSRNAIKGIIQEQFKNWEYRNLKIDENGTTTKILN